LLAVKSQAAVAAAWLTVRCPAEQEAAGALQGDAGGAGKGTSPALAALAEPGAPGRHAPLELSPQAEAKDPELAALLRKAGPRGRLAHSSSHRHAWLGTSALQMTWAPAQ